MKEGAADVPATAAGMTERAALAVGQLGERGFRHGRRGGERRIMKFVAAHRAARRAERAVGQQPRLAIAEMQPARTRQRHLLSRDRDHERVAWMERRRAGAGDFTGVFGRRAIRDPAFHAGYKHHCAISRA